MAFFFFDSIRFSHSFAGRATSCSLLCRNRFFHMCQITDTTTYCSCVRIICFSFCFFFFFVIFNFLFLLPCTVHTTKATPIKALLNRFSFFSCLFLIRFNYYKLNIKYFFFMAWSMPHGK